jgi:hypothetical protein
MKHQIDELLAKHGLTVESVFIPWSKSRNAGEKMPSLNWRVTLVHNGRKVLTTDYSAGYGHAPSYRQGDNTLFTHNRIENECERGKSYTGKAILPEPRDVIYSLLMDSEVMDYDSFESWADWFGYDQDSRQTEKTYNDCLKIALRLRKIGESVIEELREAYQDY